MTETPDGLSPDPALGDAIERIQVELAKCRRHRDAMAVDPAGANEVEYVEELGRVAALTEALSKVAVAADVESALMLVAELAPSATEAAGPLDKARTAGWGEAVELALDVLRGEG